MNYNNRPHTDPPENTGSSNTFMVNPTPPVPSPSPAKASADACKSFVGTGMTPLEREEGLPELKGAAIFVNGYHSNPIENFEQTWNNAKKDINPDHPRHKDYQQGESVSERDRADEEDIFSNDELERQLPEDMRNPRMITRVQKMGNWYTPFSFNNDVSKFWSYWNKKANKFYAADTYGRYFNAWRNDHYINGAHGLASNAAHRIDHGIALGYQWGRPHWD